jgi:hypothetical protein
VLFVLVLSTVPPMLGWGAVPEGDEDDADADEQEV